MFRTNDQYCESPKHNDLFRLPVPRTALYVAHDKLWRYPLYTKGACIRIADPHVRFDSANSKAAVYFRATPTQTRL